MKHLTAEQVLDLLDAEKQALVCFATVKDLLMVQSTLERIDNSRATTLFRIEPDENNTQMWQRPKHPTFSLHRKGREVWSVVGCDALQAKLDSNEL